ICRLMFTICAWRILRRFTTSVIWMRDRNSLVCACTAKIETWLFSRSTTISRGKSISPEKWGNLPGGEIFTSPGEVNGTFVIDGVVGDYLCAKFGNLQGNPLTVRIKGNRLVEAHSENRELENDFWKYTHTDGNSDRVGEFAIGKNIDLKEVIGQ